MLALISSRGTRPLCPVPCFLPYGQSSRQLNNQPDSSSETRLGRSGRRSGRRIRLIGPASELNRSMCNNIPAKTIIMHDK